MNDDDDDVVVVVVVVIVIVIGVDDNGDDDDDDDDDADDDDDDGGDDDDDGGGGDDDDDGGACVSPRPQGVVALGVRVIHQAGSQKCCKNLANEAGPLPPHTIGGPSHWGGGRGSPETGLIHIYIYIEI